MATDRKRERKAVGLEFTPRFGSLQSSDVAMVLHRATGYDSEPVVAAEF